MEGEGEWVERIVVPLCHGGRKWDREPCATVAESRDRSPCAMVAQSIFRSLVSWWQKVRVGALCHDGRK